MAGGGLFRVAVEPCDERRPRHHADSTCRASLTNGGGFDCPPCRGEVGVEGRAAARCYRACRWDSHPIALNCRGLVNLPGFAGSRLWCGAYCFHKPQQISTDTLLTGGAAYSSPQVETCPPLEVLRTRPAPISRGCQSSKDLPNSQRGLGGILSIFSRCIDHPSRDAL